jgi:hypothetical protein
MRESPHSPKSRIRNLVILAGKGELRIRFITVQIIIGHNTLGQTTGGRISFEAHHRTRYRELEGKTKSEVQGFAPSKRGTSRDIHQAWTTELARIRRLKRITAQARYEEMIEILNCTSGDISKHVAQVIAL